MTEGVSATSGATRTNATASAEASNKISEALKELAKSAKTTSLDSAKLSTLSIDDMQKELEQLKVERQLNVSKIEKYQEEIKTLSEEASNLIKEALKEQDKTIQEHEEKTQLAVQTEIDKYIEANKTKEGSMSKSELANNISNAIGNPNLSKALEKILSANQEIAQIDDYLGQINSLTLEIEGLDLSISNTSTAIDDAQKKAEAEAAAQAAEQAKANDSEFATKEDLKEMMNSLKSGSGCCDPIGFNVENQGEKTQYDFIVDDGKFDSTSDFLGAKDQWEAMKALDTDNDGIVNAKELKDGNIKAVKTDATGNKQVVDLAEEFGEDFSVSLDSYKSGGSYDGIDTTKDADGNGVVDQNLLGTFSVNIKGQSVQGYNTLDDTEYLKSQYGIEAATDATSAEGDIGTFKNFFVTYTQKSQELKQQADDAMTKQGLSTGTIDLLKSAAKLDATAQATEFDKKLQKEVDTEQRAKLEEEAEAKIAKQQEEEKNKAEAEAKQKAEDEAKKKAEEEAAKKADQESSDN